MQGKMNGNLERKGPHKSMHCKFCKPPGVPVEDKTPYPQLETKTKIHLVHEGADLTVYDVHDEPGMPAVEHDACICILEGDKDCPKCLPDKNQPPKKKKVCRCPRGSKPHPSIYNQTPVLKKTMVQDDEFWWEKYSREHDALAKETWAAYMAQRKKDKKLALCQKKAERVALDKAFSNKPNWYQKLSCEQVLYVEHLSTAIRLDSDENVIDRTYFILGSLGLYPRPSKKTVEKCLKFCHYNALIFLNQLHILIKDIDPFHEKRSQPVGDAYTWNEILVMNAICHLEFPAVLREIIDRMPPLRRETILPQIPYPVYRNPKKIKYDCPYDEPLWRDRMNWVEKKVIDKLNKARAYMETKRVKIPPLALVRRPSLIDNRPPFLAQIEANEKSSRRLMKEKPKKVAKMHQVSTFNSAVDVTAIEGIEASDVSTTDKADTDDICVFLREPKPPSMMEEDREQEELIAEKEVRFLEDEEELNTQMNLIKDLPVFAECAGEEDIPFRTPPKRESGTTIQTPCPPPDGTPGPPVTHYEIAKREGGILKKELCMFHPLVSASTRTIKNEKIFKEENIEEKLKSAAEKLKSFINEPEEEEEKLTKKKKKKKRKRSKKRKKSKKRKRTVIEMPDFSYKLYDEEEEEEEEEEERENRAEDIDPFEDEGVEEEEVEEFKSFRSKSSRNRKSSEVSDPDPDPDVDWPPRPLCLTGEEEEEEKPKNKKKSKIKREKCKLRKRSSKKKKAKNRPLDMVLREESEEYIKKPQSTVREEKVTMTECYRGEFDYLYKEEKETKEPEKKSIPESEVYRGDPMELIKGIIKDLSEEGFICASYKNFVLHDDIKQLIAYLKGEVINQKRQKKLNALTKSLWLNSKGLNKVVIPQLPISESRVSSLNWNDKKWVSKLAKTKVDEVYFNQALSRASGGKELYLTLNQAYFGTERYLKAFYAYMVSKYEDCIMKGL